MGLFSKLFGKKDEIEIFDYANNKLHIDCSEFGININGNNWKTEVDTGEVTEVFKKRILGNYSVVAEYCKFMDCSEYANIEMQSE